MISKKFKLAITSAAVLAAIGLAVGTYLFNAGSAQANNQDKNTSTGVTYRMTDASIVDDGYSTLVRTKDGISANLQTSGLEPGNAYTMWWVIFNNPEECDYPAPGITSCGEGDVFGRPLGETPVKVSVQFASGNIVGETCTANFGAYLMEGEISEIPGQHIFGPGLINAQKAEVHLVVRDHSPAIPGMEEAQLTTFGGACTAETDPTGVLAQSAPMRALMSSSLPTFPTNCANHEVSLAAAPADGGLTWAAARPIGLYVGTS